VRVATAKENAQVSAPEGTEAIDALAEAVEEGAGLPAVARAAAKVLGASVALIDRSSAVLAVAGASPDQEQKLLSAAAGVEEVPLRVAGQEVGELRHRGGGDVNPAVRRMVCTLLALEVERARSPEWQNQEAAAVFVRALLGGDAGGPEDVLARAAEMGTELEAGGGVLIARAAPRVAQTGDWRARVLTLATRSLRSVAPGSLCAFGDGEVAEVDVVVPADGEDRLARAADALHRELAEGLSGFHLTIGRSRHVADPEDLPRAGSEARLAVNVGEAEGVELLAFAETGSYRLLLGSMAEDAEELRQFYAETVEPLSAYDEQYETELVRTIETFLANDGNVAATAKELYTHRHTIRYRLERARELCGHDVSATQGREKLGLGLKAMRVLGISSPRGPALEPGAGAGTVRRAGEE
jgi:sugar diacid utilization regulator